MSELLLYHIFQKQAASWTLPVIGRKLHYCSGLCHPHGLVPLSRLLPVPSGPWAGKPGFLSLAAISAQALPTSSLHIRSQVRNQLNQQYATHQYTKDQTCYIQSLSWGCDRLRLIVHWAQRHTDRIYPPVGYIGRTKPILSPVESHERPVLAGV